MTLEDCYFKRLRAKPNILRLSRTEYGLNMKIKFQIDLRKTETCQENLVTASDVFPFESITPPWWLHPRMSSCKVCGDTTLWIISCRCYSPYSFHFHHWFDHCFDAVLVWYHPFDTFIVFSRIIDSVYLVCSHNGWSSSHPVIWFGLNEGHNDEAFNVL